MRNDSSRPTVFQKVARHVFWPDRRRIREAHLRTLRHSALVVKLKVALASAVVALVLVLIIWPVVNSDRLGMAFMFEGVTAGGDGESPGMVRPRLHGVDRKGQPYNITADKATQEGDDRLFLKNISGDIKLKDGAWISLSSRTGDYRMEEKSVMLKGTVHIATDQGYTFDTEAARLDLEKGEAVGTVPVLIEGPMGVLRAEGFTIRNSGNDIDFTGGVRLKIRPEEQGR